MNQSVRPLDPNADPNTDPNAHSNALQQPDPSPAQSDRIGAAMVKMLYRQSNAVLFANIVIPGAAVLVMRHSVPLRTLLIWCGVIYVLTAIRTVMALRYFRCAPQGASARVWAYRFMVLSWISAALWGVTGTTLMLPPDPTLFAFSCIVLAGMSSGAIASLSSHPPTFVGSQAVMLLPFALYCLGREGDVYGVYFVFAVSLFLGNLYYGRVAYRNQVESVRLRFENLDLIGELEHQRDRATAADRAKTRFLAAASHDLRQPVHAMGLLNAALSGLARRGDVASAQASQIASRFGTTLHAIGEMLDGLLNVSRLDAKLVPVNRQPISLAQLLGDLRDEYAGQARQTGARLRVRASQAWIESDPVLLKRILDNLLSNALRYAPNGRIVLGTRRRGDLQDIMVIDEGAGIPADQQAMVFEEFTQLGAVSERSDQGLGLGLSIVQRLAGLLGHAVTLRSEPGKGCVFTVSAPRLAAPAPALDLIQIHGTRLPSIRDGAPLHIMLIDDDMRVRAALDTLLRLWGHTVYAGASAAEVRQAHAGTDPQARVDILIADYRLADGATGFEAIRHLRDYLATHVPALIVTGDTAPDRLRMLNASGFRVLHKPIAAERLEAAIHEVAAGERVLP